MCRKPCGVTLRPVFGARRLQPTCFDQLRDGADQERQRYAARGGRIIWRILMPKTRNHLYYRLDETAREVEVLIVWNAAAGKSPDV